MILKNKNIILTGATSGIGKSLLTKLLNEGANVSFCGRSENKMKQVLSDLSEIDNDRYFSMVFDLTDESQIIQFVKESIDKMGQIDILINCAGVNSARALVSDIKTEDLNFMIKVNFIAPFVLMREVYNNMKPRKSGQIINILSTVCLFSNEGIGAYTSSKAGLDALTKVFRKEARKNNIRVTSVYPGGVNTDFRENPREDYLTPESAADSIISTIKFNDNTSIDELVLRPLVETNFS